MAGDGVLFEVYHIFQQDPEHLVKSLLGPKVSRWVCKHRVLEAPLAQRLLLEGSHRAETFDLPERKQVNELST